MLNEEQSRHAAGNNLLFDFTVDKSTNSVLITREFDAELSLVWDAFTKQEWVVEMLSRILTKTVTLIQPPIKLQQTNLI